MTREAGDPVRDGSRGRLLVLGGGGGCRRDRPGAARARRAGARHRAAAPRAGRHTPGRGPAHPRRGRARPRGPAGAVAGVGSPMSWGPGWAARGVCPRQHQALAADHAWAGLHVVVSTGTASGKSLAYQLPVLAALPADPRRPPSISRPPRRWGADQLRATGALDPGGAPELHPATYDGTLRAERESVRPRRDGSSPNPTCSPRALLPHGRWTTFLRRLRYVVVDEAHAYRGVFGSHVALVLRRLRRPARGTARTRRSCWPRRRCPTRRSRPAR